MLTLFAIPKAFRDHIGTIQRNALQSWRAALPGAQILILGNEEGAEHAARSIGAEHVGGLATSEHGAPLLSDAFRRAAHAARHEVMAWVNADIVFSRPLVHAFRRLPDGPFLMIGRCRDVDVRAPIAFGTPTASGDLSRLWQDGRCRGPLAMDYFFFSRGLFDPVPPFAVGRARYDNWLVWRARRERVPVVDGTDVVRALHQAHDYGHVKGGLRETRSGADARTNRRLAGWPRYLHLHGILDCTHTLGEDGLRSRRLRNTAFPRQLALRLALLAAGR